MIGGLQPAHILKGWAHAARHRPLRLRRLVHAGARARRGMAGQGAARRRRHFTGGHRRRVTWRPRRASRTRSARSARCRPRWPRPGRACRSSPSSSRRSSDRLAFGPFKSWNALVSVVTAATAIMYAFAPLSLAALHKVDRGRQRSYRVPMPRLVLPAAFCSANLIMYWGGFGRLWKLAAATIVDHLNAAKWFTVFWRALRRRFRRLRRAARQPHPSRQHLGLALLRPMLGGFLIAFFAVIDILAHRVLIATFIGQACVFADVPLTSWTYLWYNVVGCVASVVAALVVNYPVTAAAVTRTRPRTSKLRATHVHVFARPKPFRSTDVARARAPRRQHGRQLACARARRARRRLRRHRHEPALRAAGVLRRASTASAPTPGERLGVLSLIFWALTMVVIVKYLMFIMRADNHGEGGILALLALVPIAASKTSATHGSCVAVLLALFGAALLYGDGMITPADLRARRGRRPASRRRPAFAACVVPLTVRRSCRPVRRSRGAARGGIGAVFGPVMVLWFVAIGALGGRPDRARTRGARARQPALRGRCSCAHGTGTAFLVLGVGRPRASPAARRCTPTWATSARAPIRSPGSRVVLPGAVLNYFGQGALCLAATARRSTNPFFALVAGGRC